ncbi:unnamed protein product [Caenorhabditis auriculariae]|uniref:Receptor L-domain domain-containing protein n=1 Tax=Caenorhabditis auriculariae TaxID=2777116 RepID=A0A8S1HKA1_9PELO|nr:unnamed protein product [Caenorhabditis auriculariae]
MRTIFLLLLMTAMFMSARSPMPKPSVADKCCGVIISIKNNGSLSSIPKTCLNTTCTEKKIELHDFFTNLPIFTNSTNSTNSTNVTNSTNSKKPTEKLLNNFVVASLIYIENSHSNLSIFENLERIETNVSDQVIIKIKNASLSSTSFAKLEKIHVGKLKKYCNKKVKIFEYSKDLNKKVVQNIEKAVNKTLSHCPDNFFYGDEKKTGTALLGGMGEGGTGFVVLLYAGLALFIIVPSAFLIWMYINNKNRKARVQELPPPVVVEDTIGQDEINTNTMLISQMTAAMNEERLREEQSKDVTRQGEAEEQPTQPSKEDMKSTTKKKSKDGKKLDDTSKKVKTAKEKKDGKTIKENKRKKNSKEVTTKSAERMKKNSKEATKSSERKRKKNSKPKDATKSSERKKKNSKEVTAKSEERKKNSKESIANSAERKKNSNGSTANSAERKKNSKDNTVKSVERKTKPSVEAVPKKEEAPENPKEVSVDNSKEADKTVEP